MVAPPQIKQDFHGKTPYFNGENVENGLSGRPDNPFCPKFFRRPEVRTDKKLSGPSPKP